MARGRKVETGVKETIKDGYCLRALAKGKTGDIFGGIHITE